MTWARLWSASSSIPAPNAWQRAVIERSNYLFKITDPAQTKSLVISDRKPKFMLPGWAAEQQRHVWQSKSKASDVGVQCAGLAGTMVAADAYGVTCAPDAVGRHACGHNNGWILWHAAETYNFDGQHPCPVGQGLTDFHVCAPEGNPLLSQFGTHDADAGPGQQPTVKGGRHTGTAAAGGGGGSGCDPRLFEWWFCRRAHVWTGPAKKLSRCGAWPVAGVSLTSLAEQPDPAPPSPLAFCAPLG